MAALRRIRQVQQSLVFREACVGDLVVVPSEWCENIAALKQRKFGNIESVTYSSIFVKLHGSNDDEKPMRLVKGNKNHSFDIPRLTNRQSDSQLTISIYNKNGAVVFILNITTGADNTEVEGGTVRVFDTFRRTILKEEFEEYACMGNEIVVFKITSKCFFFVLSTKIVLLKTNSSENIHDFATDGDKVYIKCGKKWKECPVVVLFWNDEDLTKSTQLNIAEQFLIHREAS